MKNSKNNTKGITLVTLIITIVVLLILASFATYTGIDVIKSSKFKKFTTELKIMQTQVNQLYDKYKNGDNEILNLGKELNTNLVQEQVNKVFTSNESGITDPAEYRYFDQDTIKALNIQGIEEEFFINIKKRSVVSYKGFKYEGKTYYTVEQIPSGLYNIDYENKNTAKPEFKAEVKELWGNKWKVNVSDINYSGYINKWKVNYKLEGQNNWSTSKDLSFVLTEDGTYILQLVNGMIKSEEKKIKIVNGTSRLPSGYQEVEYIEGTGTQYINSIQFPSEFRYELECELKQDTSYYNIFDTGNQAKVMLWVVNGQLEANALNANKLSTPMGKKITVFYDILNSVGEFGYIDNEEKETGNFTKRVTDSIVQLFNRNGGQAYKGKIYSIKIYDSKDLRYSFIPCYSTTTVIDVNGKTCPSGTIGLYDAVNDIFYKNEGTGSFKAGPIKNDNLSYYQQVEYIEGTGTQYIKTNFIPSKNKLRIVTNFLYPREHAGLSLFGNSATTPYYLTVYGSVPTFWVGNSKNMSCGIQTLLNTKYTLDVEVNDGTLTAIWNGEKFTTNYSGDLNKEYEYYIFGSNNKGACAEMQTGYRLYDLKIYENDILVRDFVPCYRKLNSEIGLFDKVNNKFYTNQGTGTFEKGTDVN